MVQNTNLEDTPISDKEMSSPIQSYSEADILRLNMRDAIELCKECGIPWEDKENLDEYKDLLLKALQSHEENPNRIQTINIKEKLSRSIAKYGSMKTKVAEMYTELRTITRNKSFDDYIKNGLLKQYKEYKKIIDFNLQDLSLDDCPIVVTGETSAGKSSLLNHLLGDDILPTSVLRCTYAICRLRNSEHKRICIQDYEGDKREFANMSDEDLKKKVKEYTSIQAGKKAERVKYVDLYWPIPMLQDNIVIVDTPGVGTSDQLTERLVEYLPNAVAFVYVINSPNDGGLQTDRLVKVIEQQSKWKKEGKLQTFDSSTAIFVCNKWDLIPKEEEADVLGDITSKLKRYWPGMQESQIFTLCVKNMRQRHVEEFTGLTESLQKLVLASLELKIKRHIDWLVEFLECICHLIASKINVSKMGLKKRVKEIFKTKGMISDLTKKVDEVKNDVISKIEDVCKDHAYRLWFHLQSEEIRDKMFSWVEDDCPSVQTYFRSVYDVKRRAWELILTRVEDEMFEWTNNNSDVKMSHEVILLKITEGYEDVKQDLVDIEELMEGQQKTIKDKIETPSQLVEFHSTRAYFSILEFFLEMLNIFSKPEKYTRERLTYMNGWTEEAMQWLTETRVKKCLDMMCFNDVIKAVENVFETSLGNRIQADREVLDELWNFRENYDDTRKHYGPLKDNCERLTGKLELFQGIHLSNSNIDSSRLRRGKEIGKGSFGFVYQAEYYEQNQWISAAVKVTRRPLLEVEIYGVFFEIRCLLSLKHTNILKMYGYSLTQEEEGITLQIVTELCSGSLDIQTTPSNSCSAECDGHEFLERLQHFFDLGKQIADGLEFIHMSGYIHRDLKLENILVQDNTYKISDVGLAKPQNLTTGTYAGTPVYIAPEIILNLYNPVPTAVDIYSLAFLLWEVWYGVRVYDDYEVYTGPASNFRDFIASRGRPDFKKEKKPLPSVMRLIQSCWDQNPELRPEASIIKKNFSDFQNDT